MKLFLIILIILVILFIPIPLKISTYYSAEDYYIKFYRFIILSKQKNKLKKKKEKELYKDKTANKDNLKKKKTTKFKLDNFRVKDIRPLILKLYNRSFKPWLKFKCNIDYSLNDAAQTALLYGSICQQLPYLVHLISNIPFKSDKFTFDINPIFEDKFLLKIEISSIIFISLAHIIYVLILFRVLINVREVNPS